MQGELSVQFDDLFMKAWEENVVPETESDGMYNLDFDISLWVHLLMMF